MGTKGLGKTMIAKNIAYAALQAGYSVMFRTAPEILADLHCDSPQALRRKLNKYSRPALLTIDEVGYLSYDNAAADLLYEVVNRRYERRSILITTNKCCRRASQRRRTRRWRTLNDDKAPFFTQTIPSAPPAGETPPHSASASVDQAPPSGTTTQTTSVNAPRMLPHPAFGF
jgi:hypothetical protein